MSKTPFDKLYPMQTKKISIVFSFRNEEDVLPELINRTNAVMDQGLEDYELIFVNDDSTDHSLDILLGFSHKNPKIKIINMSRKFGVSECVLAGFSYSSGDAVIYMDADLQDPPEVIPELINKWKAGAEIVHTVRKKRLGENPFKMLLTRIAYKFIRAISISNLPTDAGDFKLISRKALDHVLSLKETDPYLRGLIVWVGFAQESIEYIRDKRGGGETHFPIFSKNPWKTLASGITSFSFFPIYLVFVSSFISLLILVGVIFWGFLKIASGTPLFFDFWLLLTLLFLGTSILSSLSAIGVYIIRTYKDTRGRPLYIVKETVGFNKET